MNCNADVIFVGHENTSTQMTIFILKSVSFPYIFEFPTNNLPSPSASLVQKFIQFPSDHVIFQLFPPAIGVWVSLWFIRYCRKVA